MSPLPIAAAIYAPDTDPSTVLAALAATLRDRGVRVAGVVQHDLGAGAMCAMELEILPSGMRLPMTQNLGTGASGCRLDPAALAAAAAQVQAALDTGPQLAVFNKFATQEVAGEGFRDEMAAAVLAGIPLLTTVAARYIDEWQDFTGGDSTLLACTPDAMIAWWDALTAPDES